MCSRSRLGSNLPRQTNSWASTGAKTLRAAARRSAQVQETVGNSGKSSAGASGGWRACASRSSFWTQKRAVKRVSVKRLYFSKGCVQIILSPNVTSGDLRGRCRNSCGRSENRENSGIHPDRGQGCFRQLFGARRRPREHVASRSPRQVAENRAGGADAGRPVRAALARFVHAKSCVLTEFR